MRFLEKELRRRFLAANGPARSDKGLAGRYFEVFPNEIAPHYRARLCDLVRIGFADPSRIGLTRSRPARYQNFVGASSLAPPRSYPSLRSDTTLFRLSAYESWRSPGYQTKKPARLRLVGFVTPSGFKPETY